jgi:hypothetical protein
VAVVAGLMTACTGGGSTVSASSSTVSAGQSLLAKINDPTFNASYSVDGTLNVGGASATVTGEGQGYGADSKEQDSLSVQGTTQQWADVTVGGKDYHQDGQGPWVLQTTKYTDPFQRLTSLEDLGSADLNGQALEHFRPSGGFALEPSDLGLGSDVTNFSGSLDLYATPDQTPAAFVVASAYDQQGTHVDGSLTQTLSGIGTVGPIAAPTTYWITYRSKRGGYSIARPSTWHETTYKKEPVLVDETGYERIWESTVPVRSGLTIKQLVPGVAAWEKVTAKPDSMRQTTIAGSPAAVLTYHIPLAGKPSFFQQADVLVGNKAYVVWWASKPGSEKADMQTFQEALSTLTILSVAGSASSATV